MSFSRCMLYQFNIDVILSRCFVVCTLLYCFCHFFCCFHLAETFGWCCQLFSSFFSFFLEAFLEMAFYNFCISWSCNKFLHFSSLKTWIFWCLVVCSSLLSLNILMSSFAYCTYLTSPPAFFPLASCILLLIFFGIRFLNFFSSLIFAWLFHFSVCSLCLFVFWKFFLLVSNVGFCCPYNGMFQVFQNICIWSFDVASGLNFLFDLFFIPVLLI